MQRLYNLVVIDRYRPELGVKSRQPDIEIVGVLVPNDDRKRSSEDAVADEIGFILHPGLFVHAQETLVLFACQANVIAVSYTHLTLPTKLEV